MLQPELFQALKHIDAEGVLSILDLLGSQRGGHVGQAAVTLLNMRAKHLINVMKLVEKCLLRELTPSKMRWCPLYWV